VQEAAEEPSATQQPEKPGAQRGSGRPPSFRRHTLRTRHCPACRSAKIKRSRRRGFIEIFLLPLFLHRPFKCQHCSKRFYGFSAGRRTLRLAFTVLILLGLTGAFLGSLWYVFRAMAR